MFIGPVWAQDARFAALALPFGQRADWREWGSFLTNVVKKLGRDFSADQGDQLGEIFLDARYQLVQTLSSGSEAVSANSPTLLPDSNRATNPRKGPVPFGSTFKVQTYGG